jgi:NADH-quinone oxidoreductase subunit G
MVNFMGRIQRLRPAVATLELDRTLDNMSLSRLDKFGTQYDSWAKGNKHDARSSWKIVQALMQLFGHKAKFSTAEELFLDMAKSNESFRGLNYEIIGDSGTQLLKEVQTVKV